VLKRDALGRVRTPRVRREALVEEFARSGVSAQKFAALVGVNDQTLVVCVKFCKSGLERVELLSVRRRVGVEFWSDRRVAACRGSGHHRAIPRAARRPAAEEAQATGVVGGDAHDQGAAFEFLVAALEEVGAFEVFAMGLREAVEGEGFFDLRFDPSGEFEVFGLPAFEPGGEVLAGFGGVAPVVEPA